jgi:type I restriction enzyme S subunit
MLRRRWAAATVADICTFQNGHGFGPADWDDHGLPIIRIQNLNGSNNFDYFSGHPEERWLVHEGQILFAWAGTRGISFGPAIWRGPTGVLNQHIFKVSPAAGVDPGWLYRALCHVTDRIERKAHGFKSTLLHVKKDDIECQTIALPPRAEQHAIAKVLSVWDEAITTTEHLLANSRRQSRALIGQLLHGSSHWERQRLDAICNRIQRKSDGGSYEVLMISSAVGFISQDEMYSRFMAGNSLEKYILLREGEFAYNKGNSKAYEFGCIYPLEELEQGLVPHVYICFKLDESRCFRPFYKHLFESDYLRGQLGPLVNTGVRNNGLLNIRPADFFKVHVPVPPIEEQRFIAAILETSKQSLRATEGNLGKLKAEKAALMQQLLTGKRRVRIPAAAVEAEPA